MNHTKNRKKLTQYLKKLRDKTPKGLIEVYVSEAYANGSNIVGLGVMKLLEEVSKDKKEKIEEDLEMETGEQRFQCELCKGEGYISEWNEKEKTPKLVIKDCVFCNGEGLHTVIVVDKRKLSKERKLEYNDRY